MSTSKSALARSTVNASCRVHIEFVSCFVPESVLTRVAQSSGYASILEPWTGSTLTVGVPRFESVVAVEDRGGEQGRFTWLALRAEHEVEAFRSCNMPRKISIDRVSFLTNRAGFPTAKASHSKRHVHDALLLGPYHQPSSTSSVLFPWHCEEDIPRKFGSSASAVRPFNITNTSSDEGQSERPRRKTHLSPGTSHRANDSWINTDLVYSLSLPHPGVTMSAQTQTAPTWADIEDATRSGEHHHHSHPLHLLVLIH